MRFGISVRHPHRYTNTYSGSTARDSATHASGCLHTGPLRDTCSPRTHAPCPPPKINVAQRGPTRLISTGICFCSDTHGERAHRGLWPGRQATTLLPRPAAYSGGVWPWQRGLPVLVENTVLAFSDALPSSLASSVHAHSHFDMLSVSLEAADGDFSSPLLPWRLVGSLTADMSDIQSPIDVYLVVSRWGVLAVASAMSWRTLWAAQRVESFHARPVDKVRETGQFQYRYLNIHAWVDPNWLCIGSLCGPAVASRGLPRRRPRSRA